MKKDILDVDNSKRLDGPESVEELGGSMQKVLKLLFVFVRYFLPTIILYLGNIRRSRLWPSLRPSIWKSFPGNTEIT